MQTEPRPSQLWRFRLPTPGDHPAVEADLGLALFAAACLYGEPRLRLEAGYAAKPDGSTVVIEARGPAGEAVVRIFLGLASARVGDDLVAVEAITRGEAGAAATPDPVQETSDELA